MFKKTIFVITACVFLLFGFDVSAGMCGCDGEADVLYLKAENIMPGTCCGTEGFVYRNFSYSFFPEIALTRASILNYNFADSPQSESASAECTWLIDDMFSRIGVESYAFYNDKESCESSGTPNYSTDSGPINPIVSCKNSKWNVWIMVGERTQVVFKNGSESYNVAEKKIVFQSIPYLSTFTSYSGVENRLCDGGGTVTLTGGEVPEEESEAQLEDVKILIDIQAQSYKDRQMEQGPEDPPSSVDDIKCVAVFDEKPSEAPEGRLFTVKKDGTVLDVKKTGDNSQFVYVGQKGDKEIYEWEIKGWPEGWNEEGVVSTVINNGNINCEVSLKDDKKSTKKTINTLPKIGGIDGAEFKIFNMQGASASLSVADFIKKSLASKDILVGTDPFRNYKNKFSFYADLNLYNDASWSTKGFQFAWHVDETVRNIAARNNSGIVPQIVYFYSKLVFDNYTRPNQEVIYISTSMNRNAAANTSMCLHEIGHAFCGLLDEYNYSKQEKPLFYTGEKNCLKDPAKFGKYGESNLKTGCYKYKDLYIPSFESIMNRQEMKLFNVIGCGYCAMKIEKAKEDKKDQFFEKCLTMKTIKPGMLKEIECFSGIANSGDCALFSLINGKSWGRECINCVNNKCVSVKATDKKECWKSSSKTWGTCADNGQCF